MPSRTLNGALNAKLIAKPTSNRRQGPHGSARADQACGAVTASPLRHDAPFRARMTTERRGAPAALRNRRTETQTTEAQHLRGAR